MSLTEFTSDRRVKRIITHPLDDTAIQRLLIFLGYSTPAAPASTRLP